MSGTTTGKLEKIARHKKTCSKAGSLGDLERVFPCFHCSEDLNSSRWVFFTHKSLFGKHIKKRRPHRAAPIPTNLCEECRTSGLLLSEVIVKKEFKRDLDVPITVP